MSFLFWILIALSIVLFREYIFPQRQSDLYTFGYDGRDFAVMAVSGKVQRIVKTEDLEIIHILPAEKPTSRIRYRSWNGRMQAVFTRFGEKRLVDGKKRFIHEPMALLLTKEQPQDKGMSWSDIYYSGPQTFLYNNIGFVIGGGNVKIFLKLLENSTCPVMISREFHELHQEELDALFTRSGMLMRRIEFM